MLFVFEFCPTIIASLFNALHRSQKDNVRFIFQKAGRFIRIATRQYRDADRRRRFRGLHLWRIAKADPLYSVAPRTGRHRFRRSFALIGENHPSWAIAYLGILYRGAVCVPMDPHGETETLARFLDNSEAKLTFIGSESLEKFQEITRRLGREVMSIVWSSGFKRKAAD